MSTSQAARNGDLKWFTTNTEIGIIKEVSTATVHGHIELVQYFT